jgi:acyl carrier protein|tara:strand:+ start:1988 stop:2230 length:243 start_codon:yes stop_codon:yes gene_type:complete
MRRQQLFEIVQEIFRDIFEDENLILQESTNSNDIEDWDSLNHINLVVAIESELKIKFNLDELTELKDVGAMIDLIILKKQ